MKSIQALREQRNALAKEAKALLLDEPTSGLDPAASHEFSALLKKLSARGVATATAGR